VDCLQGQGQMGIITKLKLFRMTMRRRRISMGFV